MNSIDKSDINEFFKEETCEKIWNFIINSIFCIIMLIIFFIGVFAFPIWFYVLYRTLDLTKDSIF